MRSPRNPVQLNQSIDQSALSRCELTRPFPEDSYAYALSSNAAWASYKSHQNPTFFSRLATGQSPSILWLGCSDSRVPETTILGLQPGDVFVHRNIANVVSPTDISAASVIEYAVAHLKVQHVVLCGHTCCGGAAAALGDARVGGVLDTWLAPLKKLRREHAAELAGIADTERRVVRLAELNVCAGVEVLLANHVVEEAVRERGLQVHGVVYDIACGRLRDLGVGHSKKGAANAVKEEEGEVVRGKHGTLVFKDDGAAMAVR
jgi:carbonic anhydrase